MFKKYADIKSTSSTAILCIEEPELFLHPHARRALSKQIDDFCEAGHQAILTTHSTDFLHDVDFGMNIVSCKRSSNGTKTKQVSLKDYKDLFVFDYQTEIFFADLVIICEGLEEYVIKEVSNYYFGQALNAKNVSVISVQGKDQIPDFARLLYSIGVNCCVFCDFDFILRDRSEERKVHSAPAHKSLESMPEGFFRQFVDQSKGDKVRSRIQRFRTHVKGASHELFYTAKSVKQLIDAKIFTEDMYRQLLTEMNSVGIFILDGEIEGLFKNQEIVSRGGKFTNTCLFELHKKIKSGRPIVEFIDDSQLLPAIKKIITEFV